VVLLLVAGGCQTSGVRPGTEVPRYGDEIVVAGRYFRTGAPVVLWTDPGGYDAYRVERRFVPWERASWEATTRDSDDNRPSTPNRLSLRHSVLTDEEAAKVRGGGWPLELLQEKVDQFVIHYDVCGTSEQCFKVLHDLRGLSVQFMLDVDGTIYQTMDLKERAWHATIANSRSVGVEIAHIGAYRSPVGPLSQWYAKDEDGQVRLVVPERLRPGIRTPDFQGRPARNELIRGPIQGNEYVQYDFTPEQYDSLIKLTAALATALPKIQVDYPRDADGRQIPHALTREQFDVYQGLIGHYHIQQEKQDPGPAFDWDRVVVGARKRMSPEAISRMEAERGRPVQDLRRPRPATQPVTRMTPSAGPAGT
jgi:N-acetyl-anhydromuramyl-L-alanine amidase AmpD